MDKAEFRQLILETLETSLEMQLKSVRQLLGRDEFPRKATRRKGIRRKSLVDLSMKILTDEKRPVHVDELVELLLHRHGRATDRDSLSSALAKKAKQGILVKRVSAATFALREDK